MFTSSSERLVREFKVSMQSKFEMSDLGQIKYFLGVEVSQGDQGVFICQRKYTNELLDKFGMLDSNPVRNPIVPGTKLSIEGDGVLVDETQYKQLMRPDIMFVVCILSRYMAKPTRLHMMSAKRVLRYIKGTAEFGM
ncbi:uncharacterized mitochondrial protein AtMg00810-like [Ricinus communis]|uniref:uncharacterized mitochondrial protein AtMg00810-like n=1 Tax=Ricinus communis TaxID=3988 RepID=UPI00201A950C|nr:uncharacterized mitochondrial protein AtMg00810-like [Ricinus communis]